MSKTTQFDDLGKDAKDLATRGFPAPGSLKVNHETKTPFGFVLKSNGLHDKKKGFSVGMENEYKWSIGDNAAIYKSKWDNTHVGEGSLAVSDLLSKGTEVRPWWKREIDASTKQHSLTGGVLVGFANESANVQLKTNSVSDFSKHVGDVNVVVQAPKNVFWGVNVRATHVPSKKEEAPKVAAKDDTQEVEKSKNTTYDYNLKFHYVQEGSAITIAYETDPKLKQKTAGVTFFQTPSSDLKVATEFKVLPAPVVNLTTDHKWDATTSVKTKLSVGENSRLGVAYSQKVSPFATAAFGADLNVTKLLGGSAGDDHGFGFELSLK
jgi:hypothetical protein